MPAADQTRIDTIVHEAERQRQYIRIELPSRMLIGDTECKLTDLSIGGFKIVHNRLADQLFKLGEQAVKITFDFSDFSFKIEGRARPLYKKNNKIGYKFTHLSQHHSSLLRHVIKSYLSGQIMGVNDVISVVSRNNYIEGGARKSPEDKKGLGHVWRNILPMIVIFGTGILLALFVFGNIYENQRLIKSHSGMVDGDVFTLRAQENGKFISSLEEDTRFVKKDQEIGMFSPDNRKPIIIKSPCDCVIVQQSARDGEFKIMGEALYKLFPLEKAPYVSATVKAEEVERMKISSQVRVRLSGEKRFRSGKLVQFIPQENEFTRLKIKMDNPIKPEWFSKPAYVEVLAF